MIWMQKSEINGQVQYSTQSNETSHDCMLFLTTCYELFQTLHPISKTKGKFFLKNQTMFSIEKWKHL